MYDPQDDENREQLAKLQKDASKMKNIMNLEEAEAKKLEE